MIAEQPPFAVPSGPPPWPSGPRPGNGLLIGLAVFSIVLVLAGLIVLGSRALLERPTSGSWTEYYRALSLLGFVGGVLGGVGSLLLVVPGFVAAFYRSDLPDGVRRTVLIGPIAFAIGWLVVFAIFGGFLIR